MKSIIFIPVRMDSTRLPGKPLKLINGVPMVRRVYDQCIKSNATDVYVITDSLEICEYCHRNDITYVLTEECNSGTERIAKYVKNTTNDLFDIDLFINVQGDEPFINPADINSLIDIFDEDTEVITLYTDLESNERFDRNCVKLIDSITNNSILGFTRSPIANYPNEVYKHVGIYGFSKKTIFKISNLEPTENSKIETLEQHTWIENQIHIKGVYTNNVSIGVDTISDLIEADKYAKEIFDKK